MSAMKTMVYWVGLILAGLSYGKPSTGWVITILITFGVIFLFVISFAVSEKLKKYQIVFLVLYLAILTKMLGFIWNRFLWNLAPSQTYGWLAISGILIILVFVAGCKLIAYFMSKEKDQWRERDNEVYR